MQKYYQETAEQLSTAVDDVVTKFRKQLAEDGLSIDKIPKQPMAVEIVSFLLVKYLVEERLTFHIQDEQAAYQEAMELVKAAVIQYRGTYLVPPSKEQMH